MKELLRVTLDEAKVREACEAYVATRIQPDEEAFAVIYNSTERIEVQVIVRKRRVRKAKP